VVSDLVVSRIPLPDFQNRPEIFAEPGVRSSPHHEPGRMDRGVPGTHFDALPAFVAPFFVKARADTILRDIHQRNPVLGAGTGAGAASDAQSPGGDIENVF
jgi:hypothetical protein